MHPSSGIGAGAGAGSAGMGAASVRPMPTRATSFGLWPDLIRGDQAGREQPLHGLFKPPLRDALGLGLAEHQAGCVVPGGRVVTDARGLFPRGIQAGQEAASSAFSCSRSSMRSTASLILALPSGRKAPFSQRIGISSPVPA